MFSKILLSLKKGHFKSGISGQMTWQFLNALELFFS